MTDDKRIDYGYPAEIYLFGPHLRDVKPRMANSTMVPAFLSRANPGYVRYVIADDSTDDKRTGVIAEPPECRAGINSRQTFDEAAARDAFENMTTSFLTEARDRTAAIAGARWQFERDRAEIERLTIYRAFGRCQECGNEAVRSAGLQLLDERDEARRECERLRAALSWVRDGIEHFTQDEDQAQAQHLIDGIDEALKQTEE